MVFIIGDEVCWPGADSRLALRTRADLLVQLRSVGNRLGSGSLDLTEVSCEQRDETLRFKTFYSDESECLLVPEELIFEQRAGRRSCFLFELFIFNSPSSSVLIKLIKLLFVLVEIIKY